MARCRDCQGTDFCVDHGDLICTDCGLVAQSHLLDDTPEWNNYDDDIDRSRVGAPASTLLTGKGPSSTVIPKTSKTWMISKFHDHMSLSYMDRALLKVYEEIEEVAGTQMELSGNTVETAKEFYKDIKEAKVTRGENHKALIACCVYYACKLNGGNREKFEIASAFGTEKSVFTHACKEFLDLVQDKPYFERLFTTSTGQRGIIYRTLRQLPISEKLIWPYVRKVEDAYDTLRAHGDGAFDSKTPKSILCALAVVCAPRIPGLEAVTKNEVRARCKISPATLNKALELVEDVFSRHPLR